MRCMTECGTGFTRDATASPITLTLDVARLRFWHAEHALLGLAGVVFDLAEIERWLVHLCGETTPLAIVHA